MATAKSAKKAAKKTAAKSMKKGAKKAVKKVVAKPVKKAVRKAPQKPVKKLPQPSATGAKKRSKLTEWGKTAQELTELYAEDLIARANRCDEVSVFVDDIAVVSVRQKDMLHEIVGEDGAVALSAINFEKAPYWAVRRAHRQTKKQAFPATDSLSLLALLKAEFYPKRYQLEKRVQETLSAPRFLVREGLIGLLDLAVEVDPRRIEALIEQHNTSSLDCTDPGMIDKLIELGAEIPGDNWLHQLVDLDYYHAAKALLRHGASVDATDFNDQTPLHVCQSPAVAELLIAHGADIDAVDCFGRTPLFNITIDVAKLLVERGANIHHVDDDQNTLLHADSDPEHIELCLRNGCDPTAVNGDGFLAVMAHVFEGLNTMKLLLDAYPESVNASDRKGNTLLHLAAARGDLAKCEELVRRGADATLGNDEPTLARSSPTPEDMADGVAAKAEMRFGKRSAEFKRAKALVDFLRKTREKQEAKQRR